MADVITPQSCRRELAHRTSVGMEVTLLWSPADGAVAVQVFQTETGDVVELAVEPDHALNAFEHPFAYAGLQELRSALAA
jgi:hypothetical protein